MKLENFQSTITNPQFSGGRPIGSGSYTGNSSFAVASLVFAGIATTTGSFRLTDTFGVTSKFSLTSSNQVVANASQTSNDFYISVSASLSNTQIVAAIGSFLNVSASAIVSASTNTTTINFTSSINGTAGNRVSVVSGSTVTNLTGGVGISDYPYTFPFLAGGLYVGQIGDLDATTIDGSVLTFFSASGFIPGVFQSVSAFPATTALGVIALK